MNRKIPVGVLVIAIFHFLIGGGNLLSFCCGGLMLAVFGVLLASIPANNPAAQDLGAMWESLNTNIPGFVPFLIASIAANVLVSAVLVAAGFGLLRLRPWGWKWSMIISVIDIVLMLGTGAYVLAVLNPGMETLMKDMEERMAKKAKRPGVPAGQPPSPFLGGPGLNAAAAVGAALLSIAYPVATIIVLSRRKVRQAFFGPPESTQRELDEAADEFEREREAGDWPDS